MSCSTCRNYRQSVAAKLGFCSLDRGREPLTGDEIRACWQAPIVADRSYFPNAASFTNSILTFGQPSPLFERRSQFRFTIGRTF